MPFDILKTFHHDIHVWTANDIEGESYLFPWLSGWGVLEGGEREGRGGEERGEKRGKKKRKKGRKGEEKEIKGENPFFTHKTM